MGILSGIKSALGQVGILKTTGSETLAKGKNGELATLTSIIKTGLDNAGPFNYEKEENHLAKKASYNPWVASSIRALTRNAITPTLRLYNKRTNKDIEDEKVMSLLRNPFPLFDWGRWIKFNVFSREFWGDNFIYKIRAGTTSKVLIGLQPIPTNAVEIDAQKLQEQNILEYIVTLNGRQFHIPREDMIVWSDNDYADDYYRGHSKIKHLIFTIGNKNSADRHTTANFKNGGEIRGILSTEQVLKEPDIERYKKEIKKRYAGEEKTGEVMVLGGGLKWQQTGQSNADLKFELLNKATMDEVIAVFKVPKIELGMTEGMPYATAKEQRKLFWETCECPLLDSFAEALTKDLLIKEFKLSEDIAFYFDYSAVPAMQADLGLRLSNAFMMQTLGYANEKIVEVLDLPDLETPPAATGNGNARTDEEDQQQEDNAAGKKTIIIPKQFQTNYASFMKGYFLQEHGVIEKHFDTRLQKYFFDFRNKCFDFIKDDIKEKGLREKTQSKFQTFFDKELVSQTQLLKQVGMLYFVKINDTVVRKMIEKYGLKFLEGVKTHLAITKHTMNFVDINATVSRQIKDQIEQAYLEGLAAGEGVDQIAARFMGVTRDVFKLAEGRARTIARTETTAAANDLMLENFKENEVTRKSWLTAEDEQVRSLAKGDDFDHMKMDGIEQDIDLCFTVPCKTGGENIDYPGDMFNGSAGNVINCRCTLMPL